VGSYGSRHTTSKRSAIPDIAHGGMSAMKGADIVVAASKPRPRTLKPEWIKAIADDAIAFVRFWPAR